MRLRLVPLFLLAATLIPARAAHALPGDPPVELLAPADGATVQGNADGIRVSFTCPRFRPLAQAGEAGFTAGTEAYFASFSRSPAVDASERLSSDLASAGAQDLGDGTCAAVFTSRTGAESGDDAPEIVGGRVFWQIQRICGDCAGGVEVSAVRSFTVVPRAPQVRLSLPTRIYASYTAPYVVALDAARSGVGTVVLERRAGRSWRAFARARVSIDRTILVGALPKGTRSVRVRVVVGETSFTGPARVVRVRDDGRRSTSGRDDGVLRDRRSIDAGHGPAQLTVSGGGRRIARFSALVPVTCVFPNPNGQAPDQRVTTLTAVARGIRVAPDGSVAATLGSQADETSGVLLGRLRARRFVGTMTLSGGNCAGNRALTATS